MDCLIDDSKYPPILSAGQYLIENIFTLKEGRKSKVIAKSQLFIKLASKSYASGRK